MIDRGSWLNHGKLAARISILAAAHMIMINNRTEKKQQQNTPQKNTLCNRFMMPPFLHA